MAHDRHELGLEAVGLYFVGNVAVQHDVAQQRPAAAPLPHRGDHALPHPALRERELDPVPERNVQRKRLLLGGDPGGVDEGAREEPVDAVHARSQHRLARDAHEPRHLGVRGAEHAYLSSLLEECGRNISAASRKSGIHRSYLQRLMTKHGLR